jgi:folylpolyglutamate synthase/dihydropteroate synthase
MIIKFDKKKIVNVKDSIKEAIDYAYSISSSYDLICITGSLYTVGESRNNFFT